MSTADAAAKSKKLSKVTVQSDFELAREISPRRKSTEAQTIDGLVSEQLEHFGLDPASDFGKHLGGLARHLYLGQAELKRMWPVLVEELASLPREDRAARFAAQKFLCFQIAKVLDTLQHPFRKTYQSIVNSQSTALAKGAYPIFDNVTALFSAKPLVARTATYIYACAEWVDDAFQGKELLLEVYSRLLNPTNVSLANHIVDIECGERASEYFAWNFNTGMAAIDAMLSHLVGHRDIILASRNIYGGTYQLMHDWLGKKSNLDISVNFFDGYTVKDFVAALEKVQKENKQRLADGRQVFVYIESPCNPHGYVLDVPAICKEAHKRGLNVICDSTVGTPFLHRPLRRKDPMERPDFVIHSYTKDLAGTGQVMGGAVIGPTPRMFMGKHDTMPGYAPDGTARTYSYDETLFWNVYYVKGSFLDSEKAFDVLTGMHTLEFRMLQKSINTLTMAEFLGGHPDINVKCNAAPGNENATLREKCLYLGLPAPLFTFDFEGKRAGAKGAGSPAKTSANGTAAKGGKGKKGSSDHAGGGHDGGVGGGASGLFPREIFERFFDMLDPAFGHQVSLGQTNTVVLCPALTSHSELSSQALADAGITPTTTRVAVGLEDPRTLAAHLVKAAEITLDTARPGFSKKFPKPAEVDAIYRKHYLDVHKRYVESLPGMAEALK
ncbi:MAG: O-acetylhomoserine aminocarboxypropyltransferase/cysteine synthase [Phycisphaerales bacterium]|nr:O-acetylhomoserine aminocarboxypropyltransferase/cysteine synthase [Phycisphaerales bacterium]